MRCTPLVIYGVDRHGSLGGRVQARLPGVFVQQFTSRQPLDVAADAEIVVTRPGEFVEDLFARARRVSWLHSTAAGADRMLFPALVASNVFLTNSRGCYDDSVANHAIALLFALLRRLPQALAQQRERCWRHVDADEITGKTVGIVGFGSVGRAVAGRLRSLGARVLAADPVRPDADAPCDAFVAVDGSLPREVVAACDVMVLTCPLTHKTRGLVSASVLEAMKPTAFLINLSRGAVVNEDDLVAALTARRLAGAGLDVTAEEPLPEDSPLWDLPGVIITPHMAWSSPLLDDRLADLIAMNYRRFTHGEPLVNLVDKQAGF